MYLINFKLIFVILFILITCSTNLTNSSTSDHGHLKLKNDGPIDIDGVKPSDNASENSFEGSGSDDGDDEDGDDGEDEDEDDEFDNNPGNTSEGSADLPVINSNNNGNDNNKGQQKPNKPKPTKPELDDEFSGHGPDKDPNPDEDDEDDDNSYDNDEDEGEAFESPEGSGSKQVDIVALTIANRQNETVIVQSRQEEQIGTFKLSRLVKTMLSIYVVLIFTLTLVSVLIVVIRGQMN